MQKRALALGVENELFLDDCGWLEWEKPNEEERVDVCKGNYIKLYKISDDKWLATSSLNTKGYGYSSGITLAEHAYDTRNKAIRCECLKVLSRIKKEDCDSRLIKAWQTMYESAFDTTGDLFDQGRKKMDSRLQYIADHYGFQHQCVKTVEELNELGVKLAKSAVKNSLRVDAIEEIADVEIMLEQIKYLSHISEDDINDAIEYKIQRQLFRIDNESNRYTSKA